MEIDYSSLPDDELNEILNVVYAHAVQVEHPGSGCPCTSCIRNYP